MLCNSAQYGIWAMVICSLFWIDHKIFWERGLHSLPALLIFKLVPTTKCDNFRVATSLCESEAKCLAMVKTHFYKKCSHLARFESERFWNLRTLCCVFSYWRLDRHLYSALSPEPPKCRAVILRPWLFPPPLEIEPATSRPAVKCSMNWTGPAADKNVLKRWDYISA